MNTKRKIKQTLPKQLPTLDSIFKKDNQSGNVAITEYENKLSRMNFLELQNHAISLGVKPCAERGMLTRHLLTEYTKNKAKIAKLLGTKTEKKDPANLTLLEIIQNGVKR